MSICIINESKRIFGSALIAKKWRDIVKRKEFVPFKERAIFIISQAEKFGIYCPNIFIESGVMCIFYENEDKFLKFTILGNKINYVVGKKNVENYFFEWNDRSKMLALSNYLYGKNEK